MQYVILALLFAGIIWLISLPMGNFFSVISYLNPMTESEWVEVLLYFILIMILLTIAIGLVDIFRCRKAIRKNRFNQILKENEAALEKVQELRRTEKQKAAEEEECRRITAGEFDRNRLRMEQSIRLLDYIIRRNKLCELLSAAGAQQAEKMIVRNNRGQNIRKQQERMVEEYREMCGRFERS